MLADSPFACRLDAFPSRDRVRHAGLIEQLKSALEEVRELPNGYAFRFADDGSLFGRLAEWVRLESMCCPFLDFELRVDRRSGPLWLRLTGSEGAKEFLKSQFPIAAAAVPGRDSAAR
jgi:hypothetical protein